MRAILESAGIQDILTKSLGSANPHNVVKATFDALLKPAHGEEVLRARHVQRERARRARRRPLRPRLRPSRRLAASA